MAQQKSWKGKKQYGTYKTENRALKNKIKKLTRHCKNHPNDEAGKENLERIKKHGYTPRSAPREPGSNRDNPSCKYKGGDIVHGYAQKTAGEQLSELLGIPMPKPRRRKFKQKPKVAHKKSRNVKKAKAVSG